MPINKRAFIRYNALDKCFRDTELNYHIEHLLEKCNDAIKASVPQSTCIKKRQLYDDIRFMKSEQGWSAPIITNKEKKIAYYRYEDDNFSINSSTNLNKTEVEKIKSAILVLRSFEGLPQFNWIEELLPKLNQSFALDSEIKVGKSIGFQNNIYLKGIDYLSKLFEFIKYKKVLQITYEPFSGERLKQVIHPYYLKQYNNRWFLLGQNLDFESLTNFPLDRILAIEEVNEEIYQDTTIDFNNYFEDVIGVTIPENSEKEEVEMYADSNIAGYIKTKPLHGSQKPLRKFKNGYKFSIEVIPNSELESVILSFGEKIKILSPKSLKEIIKTRLLENVKQYN